MTTVALTPVDQIRNRHLVGEEGFFEKGVSPDLVARQMSMAQIPYPAHAIYVSHPLPVSIDDGRAMINPTILPGSMPLPLGPTVMYGYNNCAPMYPAVTRGSYSNLNRRPSVGSGELLPSESQDNGSLEGSPKNGKVLQEVCRYFMRTGTCGYGEKCRYHHPQSAHRPKLNSMGYPQREAEHACPFYLKNGWCGFGATCKFHHPELPPLNVAAAATMMPQMLTPVPYSPMPPHYGSMPHGGAYSTVAPAPAGPMLHWSMAPAGVPMNLNPPPQPAIYHPPYASLPIPAWSMKESLPMGSAPRMHYSSEGQNVQRQPSTESDDNAFAMGTDVSHQRHHPIGVDTKHALLPMHHAVPAAHVSVTTN